MSRGLVGFALTRNPEGFHKSFPKSCSCKQTLVIYSSVVSIFISLIMFLLCEFYGSRMVPCKKNILSGGRQINLGHFCKCACAFARCD